MATTITGVRVFDGERLREETAVRIDGETITALGWDDCSVPVTSTSTARAARCSPG